MREAMVVRGEMMAGVESFLRERYPVLEVITANTPLAKVRTEIIHSVRTLRFALLPSLRSGSRSHSE